MTKRSAPRGPRSAGAGKIFFRAADLIFPLKREGADFEKQGADFVFQGADFAFPKWREGADLPTPFRSYIILYR